MLPAPTYIPRVNWCLTLQVLVPVFLEPLHGLSDCMVVLHPSLGMPVPAQEGLGPLLDHYLHVDQLDIAILCKITNKATVSEYGNARGSALGTCHRGPRLTRYQSPLSQLSSAFAWAWLGTCEQWKQFMNEIGTLVWMGAITTCLALSTRVLIRGWRWVRNETASCHQWQFFQSEI